MLVLMTEQLMMMMMMVVVVVVLHKRSNPEIESFEIAITIPHQHS
jgi:hypothetical protein